MVLEDSGRVADNMNDTELTRAWNEHFPKWRDNRESAHICGPLCELFRHKALFVSNSKHGNCSKKKL